MGFFKKPTLRTRDDQRTSAAELSLRASILPLCLVTILFFLWVCCSVAFSVYAPLLLGNLRSSDAFQSTLLSPSIHAPTIPPKLTPPGLLLRPNRHPKQALPSRAQHHTRPLFRPASRLLWRLPACVAGPRQLAAQTLGLQGRVHLGACFVRHGRAAHVAVSCVSLVWRLLRRDICDWEWTGQSGNGCESVP